MKSQSTSSRLVTLRSGLQMRYVDRGSGPQAVILLHGYTDSSFSYSTVLPSLAVSHRVLALDQRGHGDSSKPGSGYSMRQLADDALQLMDALDLREATIVGHSMGGFVAQEIAIREPARVRNLVLVGAGAHVRNPDVAAMQAHLESFGDAMPLDFAREFQVSTIHRPVSPGFLQAVIAESSKVPAAVWRAALAAQLEVDYSTRLHRIAAPTLIIRGAEDRVFPEDAQAMLAREIAGAREVVYPGTGHAVHWERPEWFVRDVGEFLAN